MTHHIHKYHRHRQLVNPTLTHHFFMMSVQASIYLCGYDPLSSLLV